MIKGELNDTTKNQFRARNWRLNKLGYTLYQDYLRSDEWANIKIYAFSKVEFQKCYICGATTNLILHHRTYTKIRLKSMRKQIQALVSLCANCHHEVHEDNLTNKNRGLSASVRCIKRKQNKNNAQIQSTKE